VKAAFVLDQGTVLIAVSTYASIPDPDDADAVANTRA
jgi:hypothetical protein